MKIIHVSKIRKFLYNDVINVYLIIALNYSIFKKISKELNGLEFELYKLCFVSKVQVQLISYLWLKSSFNK